MTKSRMTLLFAATSLPGAAMAQADAADLAIDAQRRMVREMVSDRCPPRANPDDILVCGRRSAIEAYRLPLPVAQHPGLRERAGGEQLAAMEAGGSRCSTVGRDQLCGGGLDVLAIAFTAVRESPRRSRTGTEGDRPQRAFT
jgi:hypothetical protein